LADVKWNPRTHTLSGKLHRPKGESGYIMIAHPWSDTGTHKLPIIATDDVTTWSVRI